MKKSLFKIVMVGCVALCSSLPVTSYARAPTHQPAPRIRDMAPESRFSKAIEDLPLMPGLEVENDQDMLFVFGSERIAQTTVSGKVDVDEVYYFYQDTLPQLGWIEVTPRLYERHGESLHIEARSSNADGKAYVRFEVEPDTSSQK